MEKAQRVEIKNVQKYPNGLSVDQVYRPRGRGIILLG